MLAIVRLIGYNKLLIRRSPIIKLTAKKEYKMPNWCENTLEIKGSNQEIEQIEKLLLNEKGLLDFNVLTPMPEELYGAYVIFFDDKLDIHTAYEDRLSALCPDAFIEQLAKLYTATKNPVYLIENVDVLFNESVIFKADEPIEQSITNAVNDWLSLESGDKQWDTNPRSNPLVSAVLKAMQEHTQAYCLETYDYAHSESWARANWGTKWNVYSDETTRSNMDGSSHYGFQTAWAPAMQWFYTLMDKIGEMEDNHANICLKYGEGGMWLGGEVGINDGCTYEKTYSDEEICEFLDIDPDDIYG